MGSEGMLREWLHCVSWNVADFDSVVPAHGKVNGLERLIEYTGFDYPTNVKGKYI